LFLLEGILIWKFQRDRERAKKRERKKRRREKERKKKTLDLGGKKGLQEVLDSEASYKTIQFSLVQSA
jgi:hypothetical protein